MSISREQLFKEVWAEPMTTVGDRYGVSSSYLARVCSTLNVPRPPRGYWAKQKVGKAPTQPALPAPAAWHDLEWAPGSSVNTSRSRLVPTAPPRLPRARLASPDDATEHRLLVNVRPHFEKVYPQSSWHVEYPRPY